MAHFASSWRLSGMAGTIAFIVGTSGCSTTGPREWSDFSAWQQRERRQVQSGALRWSDFYLRSFDRLTALEPSMRQDAQLATTVLLLSSARLYEADQLSASEFERERTTREQQLQQRLR